MDCKCGIVTGINTYPANEKESLVVLRHFENQILSGVSIKRVALDRGYDTRVVHRELGLLGITGYIPGIKFPNSLEKFVFLGSTK